MEEILLLNNTVVTQDGATNEQPPSPQPNKKKSWLKKILGSTVGETNSGGLTPLQAIAKEFDQYLHYPKVDLETNPLEWWKLNDKQFPSLSKLAHHYLCVCATSVPSERVFSTGGNIVNATHNALKPHNVSKLIFLASNLQ